MSNTCWTTVRIYDSRENVKKLNEALENATNKVEFDGESASWLGNLLLNCGYNREQIENMDRDEICLRGLICGFNIEPTNPEVLTLDIESAWCPAMKALKLFVESISKTAEIYFDAEEPMCDGYWSNDPDVIAKHPDWECSIDDFC